MSRTDVSLSLAGSIRTLREIREIEAMGVIEYAVDMEPESLRFLIDGSSDATGITITSNGDYSAADLGADTFDSVVLEVNNTSSGMPAGARLDKVGSHEEDGSLLSITNAGTATIIRQTLGYLETAEFPPFDLYLFRLPYIRAYLDGQEISYDGMLVNLKTSDGKLYTDYNFYGGYLTGMYSKPPYVTGTEVADLTQAGQADLETDTGYWSYDGAAPNIYDTEFAYTGIAHEGNVADLGRALVYYRCGEIEKELHLSEDRYRVQAADTDNPISLTYMHRVRTDDDMLFYASREDKVAAENGQEVTLRAVRPVCAQVKYEHRIIPDEGTKVLIGQNNGYAMALLLAAKGNVCGYTHEVYAEVTDIDPSTAFYEDRLFFHDLTGGEFDMSVVRDYVERHPNALFAARVLEKFPLQRYTGLAENLLVSGEFHASGLPEDGLIYTEHISNDSEQPHVIYDGVHEDLYTSYLTVNISLPAFHNVDYLGYSARPYVPPYMSFGTRRESMTADYHDKFWGGDVDMSLMSGDDLNLIDWSIRADKNFRFPTYVNRIDYDSVRLLSYDEFIEHASGLMSLSKVFAKNAAELAEERTTYCEEYKARILNGGYTKNAELHVAALDCCIDAIADCMARVEESATGVIDSDEISRLWEHWKDTLMVMCLGKDNGQYVLNMTLSHMRDFYEYIYTLYNEWVLFRKEYAHGFFKNVMKFPLVAFLLAWGDVDTDPYVQTVYVDAMHPYDKDKEYHFSFDIRVAPSESTAAPDSPNVLPDSVVDLIES